MPEPLNAAQAPVYSAQAAFSANVARARSMLTLRTDPHLDAAALAARATLGDRDAIRELTYRPSLRSTGDLARAARSVYTCSCGSIIRGPRARCRKCGAENDVNASGRGRTIR